MRDLVEPADETPESEKLREELLTKGAPTRVADTVTDWYFSERPTSWWPNGDCVEEPRRREHLTWCTGDAFKGDASENLKLLKYFDIMVSAGVLRDAKGRRVRAPGVAYERPAECVAIVDELLPMFLAMGLDVARALKQAADAGLQFQSRYALEASTAGSRFLRPLTVLDMAPIRNWDRWNSPPGPDNNNPASVMYWLMEHGARGLVGLEEVIFAEPDETAGRVASAILAQVEFGLVGPRFGDPDRCRDGSPLLPATRRLASWTEHLVERASKRDGDIYLLSAVFESTEVVYRLTQQRIPEPLATKVAKLAGRALGLLRRQARDTGAACPLVDTQTGRWAYGQAMVALATTEGLGSALTNGTLLLRSLREAAVGDDLRPWPDPPLPPPPERWGWLPGGMLGLIHNIGHFEQQTDPHLLNARSTFALFLLARLKPEKDATAGPKEPDATWRRCCIRALRELAVNPDGHVHRVLYKVMERDPDPQVRAGAMTAYHELRRADGETGDVSPRRRLMAATWWLRQAHRLHLDLDVAASAARRTRNRESSQTDVGSTGARKMRNRTTPPKGERKEGGPST